MDILFNYFFITVNNKPQTPIISLNGNILHSDAPFGNQWYNQNGIIDSAINQDYTVTNSGDYFVIVTLLGCNSDTSNILNVDFEIATETATENDFIYFDPPYYPLSKTSDFTSYTKNDFSVQDQIRLAKVINGLSNRGCYVMESNSSSPKIKKIYEKYDNLKMITVKGPRYISCKADGRKPINEFVIINYKPKTYQKELQLIPAY